METTTTTIDWPRIQRQHNSSSFGCLCFASPTFSQLWCEAETNFRIHTLAEEFLQETNQHQTAQVGNAFLFNYETDVKAIRQQFIQWCIDNNKQ